MLASCIYIFVKLLQSTFQTRNIYSHDPNLWSILVYIKNMFFNFKVLENYNWFFKICASITQFFLKYVHIDFLKYLPKPKQSRAVLLSCDALVILSSFTWLLSRLIFLCVSKNGTAWRVQIKNKKSSQKVF